MLQLKPDLIGSKWLSLVEEYVTTAAVNDLYAVYTLRNEVTSDNEFFILLLFNFDGFDFVLLAFLTL